MRAGRLNHEITFQFKTQAFDSLNAPIDGTWADAFTVPAEKVSSTSREYFDVLKVNAEMTTLFRIRYKAGIDPDLHRIRFSLNPDASPSDEQIYDIFPPIDPDGHRRELLIAGREIK